MKIREAQHRDIPFIIQAIIEIESTGDSNTFNHLFSTDTEETKAILTAFFMDDENLDTEFSLNTYRIVEMEGASAGCCSVIYTDADYYRNKSELFPIHLTPFQLKNFLLNAGTLPETKSFSEQKHFIEYIYVDQQFRGRKAGEELIKSQMEILKSSVEKVYINVLESNQKALNYYKKLGFREHLKIKIDTEENIIYPAVYKMILSREL